MAAIPTERIEYRRLPELPGAELLLAEHATSNWRFFHETYTVCTLLRVPSDIEWNYRAKRHSFKAGEVSMMEPGEVHASRAGPPCDFRVLFMAPWLVESAAKELGIRSAPHLKFAQLADDHFFRTFEQFHAAVLSGASILECESRLTEAIRLLLTQCTESGAPLLVRPPRERLLRARHLIQENHWRSVRLNELSLASGLSRYYLVRAFAREFGLPPHAYQINVQVQKARSLLAAGAFPAEVAAQVGFSDQSHFTRHFKRITGVTPGAYLRGAR